MAGMFYSLQEAAERLGLSEEDFKGIVEQGKLREFRDGSNLLFKVDEVETLAAQGVSAEHQAEEIEISELEGAALEEADLAAFEPQADEAETFDIDDLGLDTPDLETPAADGFDFESESESEADSEPAFQPEFEPEFEVDEPDIMESEAAETEVLPEAGEPDITEFDTAEFMAMDSPGADEPGPEEETADFGTGDFDLAEPEIADFEIEDDTPEVPEVEESAVEMSDPEESGMSELAGTSEILLAPETGAPLPPGELTDGDTALTGEGVNLLGETDQDYEITEDTLGETSGSLGLTSGGAPGTSLDEIEGDINLDSFGSGSGLLDLSLQADDTSLGGILDEIYTADGEGPETQDEGGEEDVSAGAEMVPEDDFGAVVPAAQMAVGVPRAITAPPDTQSNILGMLLLLPLVTTLYTAIVAVAGLKGVVPSALSMIQSKIWIIVGAAAVIALIVVAIAFMSGGDSSGAKTKKPKAKKEKAKKEKKPKEKKPKEKKSFFGKKKKGNEPPPPEEMNLDDLD